MKTIDLVIAYDGQETRQRFPGGEKFRQVNGFIAAALAKRLQELLIEYGIDTTPAADPRVVALEHVPGCAPVRHYATRSNAMARGWEIEVRK